MGVVHYKFHHDLGRIYDGKNGLSPTWWIVTSCYEHKLFLEQNNKW
jgi:hypothetical protein